MNTSDSLVTYYVTFSVTVLYPYECFTSFPVWDKFNLAGPAVIGYINENALISEDNLDPKNDGRLLVTADVDKTLKWIKATAAGVEKAKGVFKKIVAKPPPKAPAAVKQVGGVAKIPGKPAAGSPAKVAAKVAAAAKAPAAAAKVAAAAADTK